MDRKTIVSQWLQSIPELGCGKQHQLIEAAGGVEKVFDMNPETTKTVLTPKQLEAFKAAKKQDPEKAYEELEKSGFHYVSLYGEGYPDRLRGIENPPIGLYFRGSLPDPNAPTVAVIGARFCSSYGRYMARQFGMELASAGIQVISGMALGIDGISQSAALQAGGYSAAVLGSGVDVCYPPENRALYDDLLKQGGVISEYPPGTQPSPGQFPQRNRIIAGLSDVVLVVEARKKSGTLITADFAYENGRKIMALPGRVTDRLSDGCNNLIQQSIATPVNTGEDIARYFRPEEDAELGSGDHQVEITMEVSLRKRFLFRMSESEWKSFMENPEADDALYRELKRNMFENPEKCEITTDFASEDLDTGTPIRNWNNAA